MLFGLKEFIRDGNRKTVQIAIGSCICDDTSLFIDFGQVQLDERE